MKEHHFNIEDASNYGIGEAVILYNIRYWLTKNKANNKHIHDGRVWTYNSYEAFAELFPYLTAKQIRTRLESLEKNGILITGNYNSFKPDRTKWYSINEEAFAIMDKPSDQTGSPFAQTGRRSAQMGGAIPDTKQHIVNTNKKQHILNSSIYKEKIDFLEKFKLLPKSEQKEKVTSFLEAVNTVDTTTAKNSLHTFLLVQEGNGTVTVLNEELANSIKEDSRFIVTSEQIIIPK